MLSDQNRSANKALPYLNCGRAVKEHGFNVRLVPLLIRGQDRWYASARDRSKRVNCMLLFYCAHCAKMVTADDDESLNQIVDWLDEHITKCPRDVYLRGNDKRCPEENWRFTIIP